MTPEEVEELVINCPLLFHMAERGSWESIREHGLLSTTALLDLYEVPEQERDQIERSHRPTSVAIEGAGLAGAIVRDQKPMSDGGLRRCLRSGLTPQQWYELLNGKVFFWLSEERLHKLTGARAYRDQEHDVLEVDSASLIKDYYEHIWLCPMNSGCTSPFPHARDESIFARIPDYLYDYWRKKKKRNDQVVELAIDYAVPNIADYVVRVVAKKGEKIISHIA